jgi:hypothetical protein
MKLVTNPPETEVSGLKQMGQVFLDVSVTIALAD